MWFEDLVGFSEDEVRDIPSQFRLDGEYLTSRTNDRRMRHGRFDTPSLATLREATRRPRRGELSVVEQVTDVQALHLAPDAAGALFQVASQFNTLEMVSPSVTPEAGIGIYEHDLTQGPACAIACGAGTIYRNYLVPLHGEVGQSEDRQVNCLSKVLLALGVPVNVLNGYALPTAEQLDAIYDQVTAMDEPTRDEILAKLQVGVHWDTEVTLGDVGHCVTQVFGSALPVAYTPHDPAKWEPFAQLVLDASYEATFRAACINAEATGNNRVYLTMLGGGAFGNAPAWILSAIKRCMRLFEHVDLDVTIISYGAPNQFLPLLLNPVDTWADQLFAEPPRQWGLRGDPFLWIELRDLLRHQAMPENESAFQTLVWSELAHLCGPDIRTPGIDRIDMKRYLAKGMSGGWVCPPAWSERLVPLLVERFRSSPRRSAADLA